MTSTEKLVAEQFSATIALLNLLSPRMNLRLAVLIGLLSLLTLVATAQPVAEPPGAERRQITVGAQPRARKHIGRSGDQAAASSASVFSNSSGEKVDEATGYRLDVSTSNSFCHYVTDYHDLDVGKATTRVVSGLTPGVKYYYRVRASWNFIAMRSIHNYSKVLYRLPCRLVNSNPCRTLIPKGTSCPTTHELLAPWARRGISSKLFSFSRIALNEQESANEYPIPRNRDG